MYSLLLNTEIEVVYLTMFLMYKLLKKKRAKQVFQILISRLHSLFCQKETI